MKTENLVILVTGGSSGLGKATAVLFLTLKNKVIIFDLNPPKNIKTEKKT